MKYEITVGEVKTQNSDVKGYASVVFGDSERKDICYPTTKEFRGELEGNILLALENLQQTGQKKYFVGDEQDIYDKVFSITQ